MTSPDALAESAGRACAGAADGPLALPERDMPMSVGKALPSRRGEEEKGVPGAEGCELPTPEDGITRQGEPPLSVDLAGTGAEGVGAGCD